MRVLVTGGCGFVGSVVARGLLRRREGLTIVALDNLSRVGTASNLPELRRLGVTVVHGDVRAAEDLETVPACDWVVDAAANPSVLAGVDGRASSRQTMSHNLGGTLNIVEYCRRHGAGLIVLSTSRVYSIRELAALPMIERSGSFVLDPEGELPRGAGPEGISERFSTAAPISLYGASKLASELVALEYGETFDLPVWVNRCGVLAGAGQFGRADQGIFAYWINAYRRGRQLRYIGFGGGGLQARDCLHPDDLVPLLLRQMAEPSRRAPRTCNLGGGIDNTMSLRQLSEWCAARFGERVVAADPEPRPFDVPWVVMNSSCARETWGWRPATRLETILDAIAEHAEANADWLEVSGA